MKGACSIPKKKLIQLFIIIPIAALALLYGSGYLSQLFFNYRAWQEAGAVFGTSPAFPDAGFVPCLAAAFHFPYGLYGLGLCIGALLHILNTLSENLIDCKGSLIHIFRNGRVVIEDRLPGCSGRSAIRQASKDNPRQEQNKKQRQRQ